MQGPASALADLPLQPMQRLCKAWTPPSGVVPQVPVPVGLRSTPLPAKLGFGAQVKSGSGDQVKSGSSAHVDLPTGPSCEDQPSQSLCDLGSKLSPGSHPSVAASAQSPPAPNLGFSPKPCATLGFNAKAIRWFHLVLRTLRVGRLTVDNSGK